MRRNEIKIGDEYAIKWDLAQKKKLPMSVFRGRVLEAKQFDVRAWNGYTHYTKTVNGFAVEVIEVLHDPRWSFRNAAKYGRGRDAQDLDIGAVINVESGANFVAPWPSYISERHSIDQAKAEQEAEQWEAENRSAQIAERLQALGFTVRPHGDPWKDDFIADADYTVATKRITLAALDRLVSVAEKHGVET